MKLSVEPNERELLKIFCPSVTKKKASEAFVFVKICSGKVTNAVQIVFFVLVIDGILLVISTCYKVLSLLSFLSTMV